MAINLFFFQNNSTDIKLTEFTSEMFRALQNSPNMQDIDYYQQSTPSISYSDTNLSKGNFPMHDFEKHLVITMPLLIFSQYSS